MLIPGVSGAENVYPSIAGNVGRMVDATTHLPSTRKTLSPCSQPPYSGYIRVARAILQLLYLREIVISTGDFPAACGRESGVGRPVLRAGYPEYGITLRGGNRKRRTCD